MLTNMNIDLAIRYMIGKTSEKEKRQFEDWLSESDTNTDQFNGFKKYWELSGKAYNDFSPDVVKGWEIVSQKTVEKAVEHKKARTLTYRIFKVAATIVILLSVAGILFQIYRSYNKPIVFFNIGNEVKSFLLPDSSSVYLNRNSKIIYYNSFYKVREVIIEGQVFFEVKRDELKPFIVKAKGSCIKVLGTSFSVETQTKCTEVIINSGKVSFYSTSGKSDTLFLTKGDKGIYLYGSQELVKQKNEDINYLSWKTHILNFQHTPIKQVVNELQKYFKVEINIDNSTIPQLYYTSEFTEPSLTDILDEMELVLNMNYKRIGNKYLISWK